MHRGAAVAAAAILLALVGCTAKVEQPATLPPLTSATVQPPASSLTSSAPAPSPSPSPLGTVTATSVPSSAPTGDPSELAAVTTAQAFVVATEEGSVKQDLAPVQNLALPSCTCIADLAAVIERQKQRKHHIVADPFTPMTVVVKSSRHNAVELRVDYLAPAFRMLGVNGKETGTAAASHVSVDMSLVYVENAWKVAKFVAAQQ